MTYLKNKYSNSQIYGFFGLFLTNAIWTYYALTFVRVIPFERDVIDYLYVMMPMLGIFVGIPLTVSFLISHRMHKHKMLNQRKQIVLLLVGFMVSFVFVISTQAISESDVIFIEHYKIEITGLKDTYTTDDIYSFNYHITGIGDSCAPKLL